MTNNRGFALVEVLIALLFISQAIIGVKSVISNGAMGVARGANYAKAVLIAQSHLNEVRLTKMREETDLKDVPLKGYPNFKLSRTVKRYENELLGTLPTKKLTITVTWTQSGRPRSYNLFYIYAKQ